MREQQMTRDIIADPKSRYGNGKSATRHFLVQRLTGVSNIVFLCFLLYIVVRLAGQDRVDMVAVLGNGLIGIPFAVLLAIVAVHMRIGMREIIEDYVHDARLNRLCLSLNSFFAILVAVAGVAAIVKLVFWG